MDSRSWEGVSSGSGRGKAAVETLDFGYIEKCTNKRQLEHILITLRSGEEGWYPDLTQFCEKKLETVAPESHVLHPTKPAVYVSELHGPQRHTIETELEEWQEAMQACAEHLGVDWSCLFEDKLPPVRSKGDVAKSKELPEACGLQKSRKTCHIRSTDYSAWDKFDVDKECEQIDLEPQARKAEKTAMNLDLPKLEQSVNTAALSDVEKWLVAEREKNKGNEALRAMDYTEAVAYYTRSISALPTTAAFNNRALAKLKLEQWHGTVQDCDHVLSLQPRNVKAFLRRCTALRSLGQLQEAQEDAFQALQIEPGHKQAQKLLHDIEKLAVNTGVEVQRLQGRWLEVTDVGRTHNGDHDCNKHSASLDKLASVSQQDHPNLMYQKCEDDDNVLVTLIPKINEHRGTKLIVEMDKNERCEQSESVTSYSSFQENDQLTLSSNMINIHKETAQECDDCGKVEQDAREKQSQTSNYDSEIEVPHPIKSSVSAARKQYLNAKTMVETEEPSSLCSTNVTTELSTFEFGQHWQWHVSKGDIRGVAALLQGVSPSHIPVLLGNKLEGAGVGCALHALRHLVNIQPDLAYQLLLYLTRTPRFQLVSMFLSEDERKAGEELLEELDCASATGKYDVASLRRILDLA